MARTILASALAAVTFAASDDHPCIFSGAIEVDQVRDDADPPTSADCAVTFDRTAYDAVTARARWVGSRVTFTNVGSGAGPVTTTIDSPPPPVDVVLGRGAAMTFEESIDANDQASAKIAVIGDEWAIPSTDYVPPEPSTCPVTVPAGAQKSPRLYGNKEIELFLRLGASPSGMVERKLFQGLTAATQTAGTIQTTGEVNALDVSMLYANVPLCIEVPPFSGMRRDEVVRLAAANVGIDPTTVKCPIGKVIQKPLLETNASLIPFLSDFCAPEDWRVYFDENGILTCEAIERKDAPYPPDWELDAALGDFDLDSLEEEPPTQPGTKIVVQVLQPVAGTGPGGAGLTQTVRTIEEDYELYAPQCVKVRPSGAPSYLFGDGSYRTQAAESLMLVERQITDVTTVNGLETYRAVTVQQFYNPLAGDPNFNSPGGEGYDGAYGDKSFRLNEAEALIEVSYDSIETTRDLYGTALATVETTKAWYAPHRGLTFVVSSRTNLLGDPGATPPSWIFAGSTARIQQVETYIVIGKVETTYQFASDGTLATQLKTTTGWFSPPSRCDITVDDNDNQDPSSPPFDNPPPNPPPSTNPAFHPTLSGPTSQNGNLFTFQLGISGAASAPSGGASPSFFAVPASSPPPFYGSNGGTPIGHVTSPPVILDPATAPQGYATVRFTGPKPTFSFGAYVIYGVFSVGIAGVTYYSNSVVFDPWANVAPGGSL
jgi:hypothetical protein